MVPIKKHGLGKGINSLIGDYSYETKKLEESGAKVQELDISSIKPNPNQPRKTFDQEPLMELAESIKQQGVLSPILVEEISDGFYTIVAGERRYRASKLAGLDKIPALVRTFTDIQRMEVSLIENIQRENLNPVEEARAYKYLIVQQGIKQDELAQRVGKSRSSIANSMRILNLPDNMLDGVEKGFISLGHAKALLGVNNPADMELLYNRILDEDLSVRQTEDLANHLNNGFRASQQNLPLKDNEKTKEKAPEIISIEEKFLSATGCKVEIKGKYKNGTLKKGKIIVPFSSEEDLERIYQLLVPGDYLYE
ncbi:MAG: ParB/RepB/Spo0J family partition protein [Sphaerochaetaceae bacterium]|nr:ParB/RepB/Spo0J family partition protein [Sphaerochaetaceae bacterium]